jgi:asparagine synthetase B (glutamine-hydrolysing)
MYKGPGAGCRYWCSRAQRHALWLGWDLDWFEWDVDAQQKLLVISMQSGAAPSSLLRTKAANPANGLVLKQEQGRWSSVLFLSRPAYDQAKTSFNAHETWIAFDGVEGHLSVWCGLLAVDPVYYHTDKASLVISNDLRLLMPRDSSHLEAAGICSLLQFGIISAPFTLFKNVKRVPPGHLLRFSRQGLAEQCVPELSVKSTDLSLQEQRPPEDVLEEALLREVDKIPLDSALLFSGGVDSGILAALARRRGKFNLRLVNCDFGTSDNGMADPEADLARKMAAHLGCKFHSFRFTTSAVPMMLERIGKDYTCPFGDYSTIPMNLLAYYAADLLKRGSWVMDGTGADGIFLGTYAWKRLNQMYRIPRPLRQLLSLAFRHEKIWPESGWLSRYLGMIHQSLQVPPAQAHVTMQTRLAGIAFVAERGTMQQLLRAQQDCLERFFCELEEREQLSLLDLVHVCLGRYAVKDYDPLRFQGMIPFFPFLSRTVIAAGYHSLNNASKLEENKATLKSLLVRDVPHEMVYRRKSGFHPPIETILTDQRVREYVGDLVLCRSNPLREFVYPQIIERLFESIWCGRAISKNHFNFLWSYIFGSIWMYQQLKSYPESSGEHVDGGGTDRKL